MVTGRLRLFLELNMASYVLQERLGRDLRNVSSATEIGDVIFFAVST